MGDSDIQTIPSTVASAAMTLAVRAPTLDLPHHPSSGPGKGSAPCRSASCKHIKDRYRSAPFSLPYSHCPTFHDGSYLYCC